MHPTEVNVRDTIDNYITVNKQTKNSVPVIVNSEFLKAKPRASSSSLAQSIHYIHVGLQTSILNYYKHTAYLHSAPCLHTQCDKNVL